MSGLVQSLLHAVLKLLYLVSPRPPSCETKNEIVVALISCDNGNTQKSYWWNKYGNMQVSMLNFPMSMMCNKHCLHGIVNTQELKLWRVETRKYRNFLSK